MAALRSARDLKLEATVGEGAARVAAANIKTNREHKGAAHSEGCIYVRLMAGEMFYHSLPLCLALLLDAGRRRSSHVCCTAAAACEPKN